MTKTHYGIIGFIILLIIVGVGSCSYFTSTDNQHRETFTINQVDDQATGNNGHQYLVFTNVGVFKDTDNIWLGKFNSSDVYSQLINWKGKTINCLVQGHRIHLTSGYENIIGDCRLVTK